MKQLRWWIDQRVDRSKIDRHAARDVAEAELRAAVLRDIRDWFRFEIGRSRPVGDDGGGIRLPGTAYVGATVWASFHVDLVGADLRMTGEPDPVPPLARVEMPDFEQHGYRAYPLVDHVADKVVATFQRYGTQVFPPLAIGTWSTSSRSSLARGWMLPGSELPWHQKLHGGGGGVTFRSASSCRTVRSGSRDTPRRHGDPCSLQRARHQDGAMIGTRD